MSEPTVGWLVPALYQNNEPTISRIAKMTKTGAHPAVSSLMRFFRYEHLPPRLQKISKPFAEIAHEMATSLEGPELAAGLRKLLEAKDCFVRAALKDD